MLKIITHGGNAHLDDFVACAEAMAAKFWNSPAGTTLEDVMENTTIERRDPTDAELDDPHVLVLDVGRVHAAKKNDFDHHQFERGSRRCAMTLFAESVQLDHDISLDAFMAKAYPWYNTRAAMDAIGPFAVAKEQGIEWTTVASFLGPFEDIVLKQFENSAPEERARIVAPLAKDILRKFDAKGRVDSKMKVHAFIRLDAGAEASDDEKVVALDFTECDPEDVDATSSMFLALEPDGIAVFRNKRGPGYAILRINDDPRLDLSKLAGRPEVAFAHNGGFYATTKEPVDVGTLAGLVNAARV